LARYGKPEIFNSDQGSQFTSADFTSVFVEAGMRVSMDERGRRRTNASYSPGNRQRVHRTPLALAET
jgi:transposase InsO family protein